jgi:hypothetical protein
MHFREIINKENSKRDKFLSRVFGIFSEEIALIWFESSKSPYKNLGRPTIYKSGSNDKGFTLDFTLQEKEEKRIYIAEMKCELEYENYAYLELNTCKQLEHHKSEAFQRFLSFAKNPEEYRVTVDAKTIQACGSILVWGAITKEGEKEVIQRTNIYDVLSLEVMMNDLLQYNDNQFRKLLDTYKDWTDYFFEKIGAV